MKILPDFTTAQKENLTISSEDITRKKREKRFYGIGVTSSTSIMEATGTSIFSITSNNSWLLGASMNKGNSFLIATAITGFY